MKIPKTFSIFFFLLLINLSIIGQTNTAVTLPQFLFPTFTKSLVLMKNGMTHMAEFNYNTVDEEMIFVEKGIYKVPDNAQAIDTIVIQNRKFVLVDNAWFEVIFKGKADLYIQNKSKYSSVGTPTAYGLTSQVNAPTNINVVRAGTQVRNLEMPDNVVVTPARINWVRANGKLEKFTSERQFLKIFPDYEVQLKDFIKKNKIDIELPADMIKLGVFCNEIMK